MTIRARGSLHGFPVFINVCVEEFSMGSRNTSVAEGSVFGVFDTRRHRRSLAESSNTRIAKHGVCMRKPLILEVKTYQQRYCFLHLCRLLCTIPQCGQVVTLKDVCNFLAIIKSSHLDDLELTLLLKNTHDPCILHIIIRTILSFDTLASPNHRGSVLINNDLLNYGHR